MKNYLNKNFIFLYTLVFSTGLYAQTISGVVSDTSGPLIGANVIIKGTSNGTTADFDGNYTLNNVSSGATIIYSFLGYTSKEAIYEGQAQINITLEEDASQLDEVVVIGYGTQKRSDVTTAISTVSGSDLKEIPAADIGQTLQGRAAGVTVINNGSPGGKTGVRIRGLSTFGNGDPLYVIDGVFTNSLNNINPGSIKKIDVLKDAAAAAIYGSRGSNGVVIITTEKGQAGKTKFKASSYTGLQNSNKRYDLLNTEQYVQYIKEINAQTDGGGTTIDVVNDDPNFNGNGVETDWQDELFRTAPITNYDFSASGGSDTGTFSFGASHFDQEGIYIDTKFKRQTFNANSEFNITDKFRMGETFGLGFSNRVAPQLSDGREPLFNILSSAPYTRVRNPDGTFSGSTQADANNSRNQIRVQDSDDNLTKTTTAIGSLYGEYELFEGLTFRSQLGLDAFFVNQDLILRAYDEGGQFNKPDTNVSKTRTDNVSTIFTNSLSYNKTFAEKHNFNVTVVSERQKTNFESVTGASINAVSSQVPILVSSGASTVSVLEEENLISYLGRLNYNFGSKYLLSASIRSDKSSRFAPGKQTGTFSAASLGWVVSKEAFLENNEVFTNLKLRGSYGETGNNQIPRNSYRSLLESIFNFPLDGGLVLGTAPGGATNLDLTWEKSIKQNFGFDLGLWYDKLTFSFDYFNNKNNDLLIRQVAPGSVGIPGGNNTGGSISVNAADITTDGLEFTLGFNDYEGDFQWNAWANLTKADNVVDVIGNADEIFRANFVPRATQVSRLAVGESAYHFYGFIFDGVYSTNQDIIDDLGADNLDPNSGASYVVQEGDAKYRDINGDGDITDEDRVIIGDPNPDFTYTINLGFNYKKFDLSFLLTGVQGVDAFNGNVYNLESQQIVLNRGVEVLNRWQNPGDVTNVPRFRFGVNDNNEISSRYIEDASYARLKNLSLGYTFDKELKSVFNGALSKIRVYAQSQNLFTITKYSGLDPEIEPYYNANGNIEGLNIDRGRGPQPRTILAGLQIEF